MTWKPIWKTVTTSTLMMTTVLGVGGLSLPSWAQSSTEETDRSSTEADATFLDWLRGLAVNPDANEPPRTKRGGSEFCLVAFDVQTTTPVWNYRPDFVIQGDLRHFVLSSADSDEPLWTSSPNESETVSYTGPPLRSGTLYTLRAENPQNANDFEARSFTLLELEDRVEVAFDLLELENEMQTAGQSEEAIVLARADYFWQRGLAVDAWAEVVPLQDTSEVAAAAIATAYERICD
ncbi:MAG: hypothetical protein AAGE59_00610 [Cyanobacteria bacterium P01_F01_bin.86]